MDTTDDTIICEQVTVLDDFVCAGPRWDKVKEIVGRFLEGLLA